MNQNNWFCCVYAIQCVPNGKVYIGRTKDLRSRLLSHFSELRKGKKALAPGRGADWQHDFDLYGEDAFDVFVLEKDIDPICSSQREAYWINEYQSADPRYGYNKDDKCFGRPLDIKAGMPPNMAKASQAPAK